MTQVLTRAYRDWTQHFISDRQISIALNISPTLPGNKLANACSARMVFVGLDEEGPVLVPGAAYKLAFGHDANGDRADIVINLNAARLAEFHIGDAEVPNRSIDLYSAFLHELAHAFFMSGGGGPHGAPASGRSPWDLSIYEERNEAVFTGRNAVRVFSGPVPLDDAWHLEQEAAGLFGSSLGRLIPAGCRFQVSALDVALASDLGLPTQYDDTIRAGRHSGIVDAGAGLDTIILGDARTAVELVQDGLGWQLADAGKSYQLTLINVERLRFPDAVLALDNDGHAGLAYRLYGLLQREPETGGLSHWVRALDQGMQPVALAREFLHSAEFASHFGERPSDQAFIEALYVGLCHRAPDPDGFHFWESETRQKPREEVLIAFAECPEVKMCVAGTLSHGILLDAEYFP
jgi:hypothetical protein